MFPETQSTRPAADSSSSPQYAAPTDAAKAANTTAGQRLAASPSAADALKAPQTPIERLRSEPTTAELLAQRGSGAANDSSAGSAPAPEVASRRDPDGRDGRRVDTDDRTRGAGRTDPRDDPRNGSSLSNDWAGRAILGRYLSGGGDWNIQNQPAWTQYMQANPSLKASLAQHTSQQAQAAVNNFRSTGQADGKYDITYHQDIENGEGIVGYQYLHGTNKDVGDFNQRGTTHVTQLPNGNYQVKMDNHFQWNDVIDPNPQYSTDRWKSTVAEVLTLGRADPYNIHIGWDASTTVEVDPSGKVVSMSGYPG
jgi:hypothetical protein